MDIMPIPGAVAVAPISPSQRIAKVRRTGENRPPDDSDDLIPEPPEGTGHLVDLYV